MTQHYNIYGSYNTFSSYIMNYNMNVIKQNITTQINKLKIENKKMLHYIKLLYNRCFFVNKTNSNTTNYVLHNYHNLKIMLDNYIHNYNKNLYKIDILMEKYNATMHNIILLESKV